MPEKNLPEIIADMFKENDKTFMTIKQIVFHMPTQIKRDLGIFNLTNTAEIQKILQPKLCNKYVFYKQGKFLYIMERKGEEDFIIEAIEKKARTPKEIATYVPFSKKKCAEILIKLIQKEKVSLKVGDDLQVRVLLNTKQSPPKDNTPSESREHHARQEKQEKNKYSEYTVEKFYSVFQSLDNGRIFVKICDLRRALGWPREIFDSALKQLRDAGLVQLHAGDTSLMTIDEIQDCFIDENNFRMGTVTWHGR